jgi:hypothetical protein
MSAKGLALRPVTTLSGWVDDHPLSAVGALVAIGALIVLLGSVGVTVDGATASVAYDGITLDRVTDTVLSQPAYVIAVVGGAAVFFFYDG